MTGIVNRVAGFIGRGLSQVPDLLTGGDPGKFDVLSALSTGATIYGARSAYRGARENARAIQIDAQQQASAAGFEARDADIEASRAALRGKQEENLIMDELLQTLSAQRAAYANAGIDVTFGTPVSIGKNTQKITEDKLEVTQSDSALNQLSLRRQAAARRQDASNILTRGTLEARNVKNAGKINALGSIAALIDRRIARG